MSEIKPIAMPGTHESFFKYFKTEGYSKDLKILDLGAGHGAFTKKLYDLGYNISACDLFPEIFHFKEIECKKVDITADFPYPDNSFDLVIAVEVSEHILDHEAFFKEINRILKPGGELQLSTPNILSLKSRMRFLYSGFFYSFGPLELDRHDGLQHVASRTIDQYNYLGLKYGYQPVEFEVDKLQSTSQWILFFFRPFMFINSIIKKNPKLHNQRKLMLGRLLFLKFKK